MVVSNVVDGQAPPVAVDIEAASQLSVAMVERGGDKVVLA
jgi:hypothetical protein